jgi:hypothetical protein
MALNNSNGSQMSAGIGLSKTDLYIGTTLYTVISLASIIGNGIVFLAFFKTSKIRNSRTNYLIVSLSCADFVAGCIAIPLYTHLVIINFEGYNKSLEYFIYQFSDVFSITASVWHLAFISFERYVFLKNTLRHPCSKLCS